MRGKGTNVSHVWSITCVTTCWVTPPIAGGSLSFWYSYIKAGWEDEVPSLTTNKDCHMGYSTGDNSKLLIVRHPGVYKSRKRGRNERRISRLDLAGDTRSWEWEIRYGWALEGKRDLEVSLLGEVGVQNHIVQHWKYIFLPIKYIDWWGERTKWHCAALKVGLFSIKYIDCYIINPIWSIYV